MSTPPRDFCKTNQIEKIVPLMDLRAPAASLAAAFLAAASLAAAFLAAASLAAAFSNAAFLAVASLAQTSTTTYR